jgi:hypothetical protein
MPEQEESRPVQPTQPAKGEPVEIPVPKKADVLRDLKKVAPPTEPERREKE